MSAVCGASCAPGASRVNWRHGVELEPEQLLDRQSVAVGPLCLAELDEAAVSPRQVAGGPAEALVLAPQLELRVDQDGILDPSGATAARTASGRLKPRIPTQYPDHAQALARVTLVPRFR